MIKIHINIENLAYKYKNYIKNKKRLAYALRAPFIM